MKSLGRIVLSFVMTLAVAVSFAAPVSNSVGKVKHIETAEFREKIFDFVTQDKWQYKGDKPCIIDFYATWCGPCRSISPFLDELAEKYKDKIYVYKVDVDKNRELAQAFGASSIPLLIFVPKGGEPQANRGALPKDELERAITTVLLK